MCTLKSSTLVNIKITEVFILYKNETNKNNVALSTLLNRQAGGFTANPGHAKVTANQEKVILHII